MTFLFLSARNQISVKHHRLTPCSGANQNPASQLYPTPKLPVYKSPKLLLFFPLGTSDFQAHELFPKQGTCHKSQTDDRFLIKKLHKKKKY